MRFTVNICTKSSSTPKGCLHPILRVGRRHPFFCIWDLAYAIVNGPYLCNESFPSKNKKLLSHMNDILELFGNINGYNDARVLFDAFVSQNDFDSAFYDLCGFHYEFLVGSDPYEKFVYQLLKNHYRNDFFIRHTFFDKVLSKKNAVSFFEMPISSSRVDMCSINGTSVGYEIKTEYDNLQRLEKQVADYSKILEYVYVVCPDSMIPEVTRIIPGHCGIYSYDERRSNSSFKIQVEAKKSPYLDSSAMLQCMLKEELKSSFQDTHPKAINENFSLDEINKALKKSLKKRYAPRMAEIENKVGLMIG